VSFRLSFIFQYFPYASNGGVICIVLIIVSMKLVIKFVSIQRSLWSNDRFIGQELMEFIVIVRYLTQFIFY